MPDTKTVLSYILSAAIVAIIISLIDPKTVLSSIAKFGLFQAIIGLVLVFFSYAIRAKIWQALLSPFAKVSLKESYNITTIGFLLNNFLPLRAGEIARAFLLDRTKSIGKLKIFSTIIVERIVEGISLVAVFVAAMLLNGNRSPELVGLMVFSGVLFAALLLAFVFSGRTKKILKKLFGFSALFREKIAQLFDEMLIGGAALKSGLKENIAIWGLSGVLWCINFALYFFVAQSLGIQIGFFELVLVLAVSTLSTIIPSAPGYIGTFEAGFIVSFSAVGLSTIDATSMAVVVHILFFAGTTVLGLFSMNSLKLSVFDLAKIGKKN
ncbi:MAG: lysylphosphatidylglycerol synthase transmembrane domain-containing protein [archaeon]